MGDYGHSRGPRRGPRGGAGLKARGLSCPGGALKPNGRTSTTTKGHTGPFNGFSPVRADTPVRSSETRQASEWGGGGFTASTARRREGWNRCCRRGVGWADAAKRDSSPRSTTGAPGPGVGRERGRGSVPIRRSRSRVPSLRSAERSLRWPPAPPRARWVPRDQLGSTSVSRCRHTPALGAHTDEVPSQVLNRSDAEIAKLHDEKIVAGL